MTPFYTQTASDIHQAEMRCHEAIVELKAAFDAFNPGKYQEAATHLGYAAEELRAAAWFVDTITDRVLRQV